VDLFEHQGKELFARYSLAVPEGEVAFTPDEAATAAERLGLPVAVKAQVHTGGRGKAGGVKLASDLEEVRRHAQNILGLNISGHVVRRLWIERTSDIAAEYYVSFTLDRSARKHLGMLSAQGGVDIESVAANDPEAIAHIHIDPVDGLSLQQCQQWVHDARIPAPADVAVAQVLANLYRAYVEADADLVEVNPLIVTVDGKAVLLDAKVTLDANSMFRHDEYAAYDTTQSRDEREQAAHAKGLQYVGLDGSVGVIANGAGLAMSTVDVVNQVGGQPANFLDIGGGANAEVMAGALEVINNDPAVRAILINIFGGITRGEEIADGIIEAVARVDIASPIVVRLDGTNATEGRELLEPHLSSKLMLAPTMLDAARKAVELAAGGTE